MKNKEIQKIVDDMHLRFTSGNAIEVERAHIKKHEWDAVVTYIASCDSNEQTTK